MFFLIPHFTLIYDRLQNKHDLPKGERQALEWFLQTSFNVTRRLNGNKVTLHEYQMQENNLDNNNRTTLRSTCITHKGTKLASSLNARTRLKISNKCPQSSSRTLFNNITTQPLLHGHLQTQRIRRWNEQKDGSLKGRKYNNTDWNRRWGQFEIFWWL